MTFKYFCIYSILLVASPTLLWGSEQPINNDFTYDMCPANSYSFLKYSPPPIFSDELIDTTDVSAQQVQNINKSTSTFTGNVLIERHQLRLQADKVIHNKETQRLEISGNIHADTENMALSADSGWMNMQTNESEFINSTYYIPEAHFSGSTPVFTISKGKKSILLDTQFTTCPNNKRDWHMDIGRLELDQSTATGTATHAVFWLSDIPVFYFPWIQFPLGDVRRSGFLTPRIGKSSANGAEFNIPFYWNIAPNQDAIITPGYLQKRGSILMTDYRYLSHSSNGQLNLEYLNNDKETNKERYLIHFDNQSRITDNLNLNLLVNDASDTEYLNDLSSNINVANTTHLERNAKLSYTNGPWKADLMAQTFQTIDQEIALTSRPYKRLPQLTLNAEEEFAEMDNSYLKASLESEWVQFKHASELKPQGSRFHIYPKLNMPIEGNAWFVKPSAGFMHTEYNIDNINDTRIEIKDRNLSIVSLDSGLFFERSLTNSSIIQTLEPRLFYLNIPFEDQSAIPLFDTSEQSFSFASLFRENRFNGIDRIGDANQLTLALSSRLLNDSSGEELFNLSIGRILYFDDRQVTLNNSIDTSDSSDVITEIGGRIKNWIGRATYQWNTDTNISDKRSVQISYAASKEAVFNIGYRFQRDPNEDIIGEINNLEQTDLSFVWPFASNYALLSRWNYDLTNERDIQTLVGIEYESCCWAIRLLSERYRRDDNEEEPYNTSISLQFVLKGFGSISDKKATDTLKQAILGYQPDY